MNSIMLMPIAIFLASVIGLRYAHSVFVANGFVIIHYLLHLASLVYVSVFYALLWYNAYVLRDIQYVVDGTMWVILLLSVADIVGMFDVFGVCDWI